MYFLYIQGHWIYRGTVPVYTGTPPRPKVTVKGSIYNNSRCIDRAPPAIERFSQPTWFWTASRITSPDFPLCPGISPPLTKRRYYHGVTNFANVWRHDDAVWWRHHVMVIFGTCVGADTMGHRSIFAFDKAFALINAVKSIDKSDIAAYSIQKSTWSMTLKNNANIRAKAH